MEEPSSLAGLRVEDEDKEGGAAVEVLASTKPSMLRVASATARSHKPVVEKILQFRTYACS